MDKAHMFACLLKVKMEKVAQQQLELKLPGSHKSSYWKLFGSDGNSISTIGYNGSMRQQMTHFDIFLRFLLLSFFSLLLSGCVSNSYWTWQHPAGLGDAELQQATNECSQLAQREVDRYDYYRPYYYYDDYYFNRHYSTYGHYRPFYRHHRYYDFYSYNADLNRFYRICMRAKGWQQIKVEILPQKSMSISPQ